MKSQLKSVFEVDVELEFIQVDSDGIFGIFYQFFIPSNLVEMTENFIRTEGGSENLTVRTIRHDAICYKLWSNSKAHAKTIIEKRILIVKPFEEGC